MLLYIKKLNDFLFSLNKRKIFSDATFRTSRNIIDTAGFSVHQQCMRLINSEYCIYVSLSNASMLLMSMNHLSLLQTMHLVSQQSVLKT